ncbi:MAG: hypothetical protein KAW45_03560 [Thermoplasmatales archaeon]|nr:hypothetical protein [Thermoplasmatales archaeon]
MDYVKKKIASWEIKYGQIQMTGKSYEIAKRIFSDYIGITFELTTFLGDFPNRHFINEDNRNSLRLACSPFFSKLDEGDIVYIKPIDVNKIEISKEEPLETAEQPKIEEMRDKAIKDDGSEITKVIIDVVKENKILREENEDLIKYKDRLEKYQNLEYIFEDEKFMEDWLERNIHKAIANLEIIDRQIVISWNESFMRNKPDFFCLDKTTRELVIVENKVRGRHRKVGTQFLIYSAWAKRNLAKINEKYKDKNLKATKSFKFVIITDTTDERLEAVCEDNKIALILIDGGVIFEEIIPYFSK